LTIFKSTLNKFEAFIEALRAAKPWSVGIDKICTFRFLEIFGIVYLAINDLLSSLKVKPLYAFSVFPEPVLHLAAWDKVNT
jgi:hypothetical protein